MGTAACTSPRPGRGTSGPTPVRSPLWEATIPATLTCESGTWQRQPFPGQLFTYRVLCFIDLHSALAFHRLSGIILYWNSGLCFSIGILKIEVIGFWERTVNGKQTSKHCTPSALPLLSMVHCFKYKRALYSIAITNNAKLVMPKPLRQHLYITRWDDKHTNSLNNSLLFETVWITK